MTAKRTRVFTFTPVGLDVWDAKPHSPAPGARVVLTQPHGCPRNGTMGMVYVNDADTGQFYGLVLQASLTATADMVVPRDLAAEARDGRRS